MARILPKETVEVELLSFDYDDDSAPFLRVCETLSRIGIPDPALPQVLRQLCYILHKRGKYYVLHFKEMYRLDGGFDNIKPEDFAIRNLIVSLLVSWKLVSVCVPEMIEQPIADRSQVMVLSHSDRSKWTLQSPYNIGRKKI